MKDNDTNDILKQFFAPAQKAEIPDDGFCKQVTERISDTYDRRIMWRSRLWTLAYSALTISLIIILDIPRKIISADTLDAKSAIHDILSHADTLNAQMRQWLTLLQHTDITHILPHLYIIPLAIYAAAAVIMLKSNKRMSL